MVRELKEQVELIIPPKAEYLQLVRLMVAGIGSISSMDVEGIEDMKLAAAEACTQYFAACQNSGQQLMVRMRAAEQGLEVEVMPWGDGKADPQDLELKSREDVISLMLMETLADRVERMHDRIGTRLSKEWLVAES